MSNTNLQRRLDRLVNVCRSAGLTHKLKPWADRDVYLELQVNIIDDQVVVIQIHPRHLGQVEAKWKYYSDDRFHVGDDQEAAIWLIKQNKPRNNVITFPKK